MTLVPVPSAPPRWRKPSYGLGLMGDPESSWGALYGHGGAGPGYNTSVLHASDLGCRAVTACAMCAVEDDSMNPGGVLRTRQDDVDLAVSSAGDAAAAELRKLSGQLLVPAGALAPAARPLDDGISGVGDRHP